MRTRQTWLNRGKFYNFSIWAQIKQVDNSALRLDEQKQSSVGPRDEARWKRERKSLSFCYECRFTCTGYPSSHSVVVVVVEFNSNFCWCLFHQIKTQTQIPRRDNKPNCWPVAGSTSELWLIWVLLLLLSRGPAKTTTSLVSKFSRKISFTTCFSYVKQRIE